MQKNLSFTRPDFNFQLHDKEDAPVTLNTYIFHLQLKPLACFIALTKINSEIESSYYSSIFIHNTNKKIFFYDIAQGNEEFDEKLYEYLTTKSERACASLFYQHGFTSISESTYKFDVQLKNQGLDADPKQVLDLLNPQAISILKLVGLGIVPSLYNWLIEGNKKTKGVSGTSAFTIPHSFVNGYGANYFRVLSRVFKSNI